MANKKRLCSECGQVANIWKLVDKKIICNDCQKVQEEKDFKRCSD